MYQFRSCEIVIIIKLGLKKYLGIGSNQKIKTLNTYDLQKIMASKTFKDKYTFEERFKEARKKKEEHPTLIPVIVEKHARSKLPEMEKAK